jgi:hypothetical protein
MDVNFGGDKPGSISQYHASTFRGSMTLNIFTTATAFSLIALLANNPSARDPIDYLVLCMFFALGVAIFPLHDHFNKVSIFCCDVSSNISCIFHKLFFVCYIIFHPVAAGVYSSILIHEEKAFELIFCPLFFFLTSIFGIISVYKFYE